MNMDGFFKRFHINAFIVFYTQDQNYKCQKYDVYYSVLLTELYLIITGARFLAKLKNFHNTSRFSKRVILSISARLED